MPRLPPSLSVMVKNCHSSVWGGVQPPPSVCGTVLGEMAAVWGDYHRQAGREWCLRKPE